MSDRKGAVTMKGNPLTLTGNELKVGQPAPEVTLTANDLSTVNLSSFKGKKTIVLTMPSLDTGICDKETRKFNEEAAKLGNDVKILAVTMDLPFAQKRWCGAAGVNNVLTLSDYKEAALGNSFGVLIKELKLLARTIFVIDSKGNVQYSQIVKEITTEPDYAAVLEAVNKIK